MFVPGNNPGMMQDAYIYGPDSIMLDLEDSVTMAEKDTARLLVYNALKSIDYGKTEMVVRINPLSTPYGKKDVEAVVKAGVDVIRMPKTETAEEVVEVEREIERVEREIGCLGRTQIMAAIESTLGVVNAYAIATASKRMMGIALGAEDYCANLKTQRSPEGMELLMARQTIVVAARAAASTPSTPCTATSTTWRPSARRWSSSISWDSMASQSSTPDRLRSSTRCLLPHRRPSTRPSP